MSAIYANLTTEQIEYLREYAELIIKQDRLTAATLTVNESGSRVLTDPNAAFEDNEVEPGDTIEILPTTPAATTPVDGSYTITRITDNNTLEFSAEVDSLGIHVAYRIINTSPLQELINSAETQKASIMTVDLSEARFQENINNPWYTTVSNIMLYYFALSSAINGQLFSYPVYESDLDAVTQVNPYPTTIAPGPLLYPYGYSGSLPDRRPGSAVLGSGTPSLLGIYDTSPSAVAGSPWDVDVPGSAKELQAIIAEENFYQNAPTDATPPPYYTGDEASYLNSIKSVLDSVLQDQIDYIDVLKVLLDEQILDLQTRGVTGTLLYSVISVARKQLDDARAEAVFHKNDATVGVPSISTSTNPSGHPRRPYITGQRINEINARMPQLRRDYSQWVDQRYSFLDRRVNRSRGSLTLLRRYNARIDDLNNEIDALKNQRTAINSILGGLVG